ncbi:MAG TPA: alpha/beta hydrolase, partial [Acidimicrobiales bacterium]|nr:alpha/beta hydrolase [Acidimicrobiales bacterium]
YRGMLEALSGDDQETRSAVFDIVGGLIIDDPDLEPVWKAKWMADDPARIVEPGGALLDRDDITDRLDEITCPALIVHGTADTAIPIEKAELLRAGLADCRDLVPIEGAAHASNLTHPAEVNRHIERLLDAL